jgi:hypothetical protein
MPQCPHCQTPYDKGQRYCSVCGSFLLQPEAGDTFCPQCGVRVSPRQEFCHECDAPLQGEAAAALKAPTPEAGAPLQPEPEGPPLAPAKGMQPWFLGLLAGAGVIIVVLLILLFTWSGAPPPPALAPKGETVAPAPALQPVAPAPPPITAPAPSEALKDQIQAVLSTLREAQLGKDIVKFMSVYSLTFPDLEQKRANTLNAWENYDYTNLVYTVDKMQPIDADNVIVWVTWYIDTRNRGTQELASVTQTYQVRFAKEMGQWRIRSLEEVAE